MVPESALDAGVEGCYAKWRLQVDLLCTDDDGNLRDAAMLAMVTALADTALPTAKLNPSTGQVTCDTTELQRLSLSCLPIAVTHGLVQDSGELLMDPTRQEEDALCSGGSVTVAYSGKGTQMCLALKPDGGSVPQQQMRACMAAAQERCKGLHTDFFSNYD